MPSAILAQSDQPKQQVNGQIRVKPGEIDVGSLVYRAPVAKRKECTTAAQQILHDAEDLATILNQSHITEDVVVLAILADKDGLSEVQKHNIDPTAAYRASWATLGTFRAPEPSSKTPVKPDETLTKVLLLAKERARRREREIDLVAVKDLVGAILELPREAGKCDPLSAHKLRRNSRIRLAGIVLAGCAVFAMLAMGVWLARTIEWTSFVSWFVST